MAQYGCARLFTNNFKIMTNYKAVVTLTNGCHKILRMSIDQVAHVVSEFRKFQQSIFNDVVKLTVNNVTLCLNEILSIKFLNEYTRQEFLTI